MDDKMYVIDISSEEGGRHDGQLRFKTEVFEGPLELLLHLISKHKLNIIDIQISELLEQYLDFIENAAIINSDIPSEFLAMAARLVYIKTLSLLPKTEEITNLKRELENALFLYQLFKQAGEALLQQSIFGKVFYRERTRYKGETEYKCIHEKREIYETYKELVGKKDKRQPPKQESFTPLVSAEYVSVSSRIIYVLRKLYTEKQVLYKEFFTDSKRSANVATFLAMLELIRSKRVRISNDDRYIMFTPIAKVKETVSNG